MKILDYEGLTYLIEKIKGLLSKKADTTYVDGKVLTDVPVGAKFTDTIYTHPTSHPASIITETTTKRFVSDAEKTTWNAKLETSALTPIETSISDLSDQLGDIISRLEALETVGGE